jgi:preprotein translocase subunit SecG
MINFANTMMAAVGANEFISYEAWQIIQPILIIFMVLCSIALIVVVMMQKSASGNVSAISGGSSDSFYGKNKSQSNEGKLKIATICMAVALLVISVIYFIMLV